MVAPAPDLAEERQEAARQLVVFALGEERLALPMSAVREIVRPLPLAPVPRAPELLLGLANLRGRVLPVLDLRRLVGAEPREPDDATRVLVLEWRGSRLGLVVDAVRRVLEAAADALETARGAAAALATDVLAGVVRDGAEVVQVLDLEALLDGRLEEVSAGTGEGPVLEAGEGRHEGAAEADEGEDDGGEQLVAFRVGGQELALRIGEVREIVRLPERVEAVPGAGPHALGLMPLRGRTLPLVSLAALLGIEAAPPAEGARVLVTALPVGGRRLAVGLVVDAVREVLRVPETAREAVPALLARGGGLGEIGQICRLEGGRRLVAVLEGGRLAALEALGEVAEANAEDADMDPESMHVEAEAEDDVQLVVFRLDGEEYGLPVEVVREITRVPERLSRVPRTPEWVEGLVNLRGSALPVLDMRARFGLPRAARSERQRILVLDLDGARTGFVTDSVTEVLSVPRALVEAAPRLEEAQARLKGRVVNLAEGGRMIVVLDPSALVDEGEREALAESARSAA